MGAVCEMNMAKNVTNKKSNNSVNRNSKSKAGKVVTLRVLVLILFDVILGSLFDYVIHAGNDLELAFYLNVRPALIWISVALFVLSVAYVVVAKTMKINTTRRPVTPEMIAVMTLILTAAVLLYNTFRMTPALFFTMMIVISILAAIYYIYTMLLY